jgi:RNA polymerase sigma factor (sigma-70 family)
MSSTSRRTSDIGRTPGQRPATDDTSSTIHIVERARRGDRSAVQVLIERASPVVRRWARGRLPSYARNGANTEDVMQDVVVRMLKNIKRFRRLTVGGLQAYLRQSVVNRIRDLVRGSKRHGVSVELPEDLRDDMPSPLEAAIRRERLDRFLAALQRLRPADRQVIVWRVELGYTVEEIAPRLGTSKAAAGMTVSRAMARLAKELEASPGVDLGK